MFHILNKNTAMSENNIVIERFNIGKTKIELPSSKSISNRALIVNNLSSNKTQLHNLSTARDTELMQSLLLSNEPERDARDAGTTMRFLTAYSILGKEKTILTGTPRMQKRPLKILVDSLRELGAEVNYLKKDGYPPVEIHPLKKQISSHIQIPGNVSSQYISALAMIGPSLPKGIEIDIIGETGSKPYIEMTCEIMRAFGGRVVYSDNHISVEPSPYTGADTYYIEPDWSAASYWYSFVALSKNGQVLLKDLTGKSIQGDSVIKDIMSQLGVSTQFTPEGALLKKTDPRTDHLKWDFKDCPDLAQTIIVVCAALKISCTATGLESLRIKETDRILALQTELGKLGVSIVEEGNTWKLLRFITPEDNVVFDTYEDHRMAMALAPLSQMMSLQINDPDVVKKSYPHFWSDVTLSANPNENKN